MKRFAIILAALFTLSVNIAHAGALDGTGADHLRFTFHSVAAIFNYDPDANRFATRTACTDRILLKLSARGWDIVADALKVKTFFDAEALRPDIRAIFRHNCLNGTGS